MRANHPAIGEHLRMHPDGMTAGELSKFLPIEPESIRRSLQTMPDAYIDRWRPTTAAGIYAAVWCVVPVPEHCPRPE